VSVRFLVVVTVALAVLFAGITASYYLFGADSARYVELGRSLAHGNGYFYFTAPERSFPPGFPAALAPVNLFLGDSFAVSARWSAIIAALVFPAAYAFARTRTAAIPIAVLTIASAGFLDIVIGNPRSEPIYMVCSFGFLAWAWHAASRPEPARRSVSFIAAGALLLLLTVATRSIGIAVVGAVAMVLLERVLAPEPGVRRFPPELVIPLVAGVAFLVLWFAWTRFASRFDSDTGVGSSYVQHLLLLDPHHRELGRVSPLAFLTRIGRNLVDQLAHAAELLTQLPWVKARWFSPFAAAVGGLTLAGLWSELRRPQRLLAWYFLGYVAILLMWPYDEGTRFLVPILPLLWLFAIVGARRTIAAVSAGNPRLRLGLMAGGGVGLGGALLSYLAEPNTFSRQDQFFVLTWLMLLGVATFGWARTQRLIRTASPRLGKPVLVGALVLYAAAGVARITPAVVAQFRGSSLTDPVTAAIRDVSTWIGSNTAAEDTILASFPAPILFATRRATVRFPFTSNPDLLRQAVERGRPDFLVVLDDTENPYYQPVDSEKFRIVQGLFPGSWHEVARLKGSTVYAFR
jgi:hypothetical protein